MSEIPKKCMLLYIHVDEFVNAPFHPFLKTCCVALTPVNLNLFHKN